jgi:uncharacterized OsmC-like protein
MSVTARSLRHYQVEISAGNHSFLSDETVRSGGDDIGPAPYDLLLASLASCKVITVLMYAERKGWPVEGVSVYLEHKKIPASECEDCQTDGNAKVDIIQSNITFAGDLDEAQIARLAEISDRCPVHRTLTSETKIRTRVVGAAGVDATGLDAAGAPA